MEKIYLDIMEKALSAYTPQRIRDYIDEVKRNGLTEHGFPRLGCNIGILIAYGRRTELKDIFIEIMDLCCDQIPRKKAANDFSVREVCCCLSLVEEKGLVSKEHTEKWKAQIAAFDPWHYYNAVDDRSGKFVNNWAMFSAVSEYMRGAYCGIDTSAFVDWQIPGQLANLDENDMYMDDPPYSNHTVYDIVPRFLMAFLLRAGYRGKYAARIEQVLDNTAEFTLKMQSVTGELAFGGRSNQFLNNEPMISCYCEMEAARFKEKGDLVKAGQFKAAALLAAEATLRYLSLDPISHVKNRYDISTEIGCEDYGYFNKYMITVASNLYAGVRFSDESIVPSLAPTLKGGYVIRTSENFHKTFLNAGGYQIEIETNADSHYDANGLGRVHKAGCPSALCLSVPFSRKPHYVLEDKNPSALSICCYTVKDGKILLGAEKYARYTFVSSKCDEGEVSAEFEVNLAKDVVTQRYTVSERGVDVTALCADGMMIPVFSFDGEKYTDITVKEGEITVEYGNSFCKYTFEGTVSEHGTYYNRNGRYRVYRIATDKVHIEMGKADEI